MREKERERKIEREREREKQRKLGRKDRGPSPVHSAIALQTLISEGAPTLGGGRDERERGSRGRERGRTEGPAQSTASVPTLIRMQGREREREREREVNLVGSASAQMPRQRTGA